MRKRPAYSRFKRQGAVQRFTGSNEGMIMEALREIQALENLAEYTERRAAFHLRNGNMKRSIECDNTARAYRREIELRKDMAA